MNVLFIGSVMCAALFGFTSFPAAVEAADPVTGKPCAECHIGILTGKVMHQPVKKNECESCHKSGGGDHRLKKGLFAPKAPAAKLCYQCHKNLSTGTSVHGPIKEGICSGCHAPHYSPYQKLLRGEGNGFCLRCHGKMAAPDKLGHAPVKTGKCGVCHLPHQSSEKSLLRPSDTGICLSCHDKSLATGASVHKPVATHQCGGCHQTHGSIPKLLKTAAAPGKTAGFCYLCHANMGTKKSVHGPIRNGDCGGCHVPHSSPYKKLLRGEGGAFCFGCHDKKPFTKPVGHGPVKSGRCMDCHTPHQSDQAKLIKPSSGLICYECHNKTLATGKSVHKPVATGQCGDCHLIHSSDSQKLLKPSPVSNGATLSFCYNCHKNLAVEKTVHAPVKQGKCTDCHSVHSSPASKLLKADGSALCFGCHNKAPFVQKKYAHEPVAAGNCTGCHQPHQSTTAKLLKSTGGAIVCYECHDKRIGIGTSVHKPVATGECGKCHAVHGGDYRKLLLGQFTEELQVPFDEANYAFCFKCHDGDAFSDLKSKNTGFRNAKTNLHAKHVRGHSCKVCHDVHSAKQPKLLRDHIYGGDGYRYTMKFTPSSNGGSCTTSCHTTESYSR